MEGGVVIDQRFRLGRVVRESMVAIVYEAKHRNGADAWIKLPNGPEHAEALSTEARVANALGQNAVNVRDDGRTAEGIPYLVLEPVKGQPLDHWREHSGGRAPPDEAMGLGDELCEVIGNMHRAGFVVGVLRADAIIVLPKGGICLLELEHARPATPALVKEDAERVGRVLYEMLSGIACLTSFPPLRDLVPELPAAMTATVDDAARGRFATIEELRLALRTSMPQWLGPMRRPMPSAQPDLGAPGFEAFDIILPRSSKSLFDPADLTESTRSGSKRIDPQVADAGWGRPSSPSRPSAELEAPAVAHSKVGRPVGSSASHAGAFDRIESGRAKRSSSVFIIAGACVAAVVVGSITFAAVVSRKDRPERVEPVAAKAATTAVTAAPATPPASTPVVVAAIPIPSASPSPVPPAPASAPPPEDRKPAAAVGGATADTTLRFEGDLSPRLVIFDGAVVGVTTKVVKVRCGTHSLKIGGKGVARSLDLPCGDDQGIVVAANGTWRAR